ncbi:MAG: alpha/beta fold hydrolase [Chloroflexi bacterium]|nr:alpha/beta fold hydrolase [Chloroflexota bacterium]
MFEATFRAGVGKGRLEICKSAGRPAGAAGRLLLASRDEYIGLATLAPRATPVAGLDWWARREVIRVEIEANGIRIAYDEAGEGTPLLLVHGFQLDRLSWASQVEAFRGCYRVIAPDLRGHGGTELGAVESISMELFAADLDALLESLAVREPAVVIGLSLGGFIAQHLVLRHPKRVRALVLADTVATADPPELAERRLRFVAEIVRANSTRSSIDGWYPRLMAPASYGRAELVAPLRAMMARHTPAGVAATLRGMAARPDCLRRLGSVTCPTLVVVGELDTLTPPDQAGLIRDVVPGAQLVVLPGIGHLSNYEAPELFNAVVADFLARTV